MSDRDKFLFQSRVQACKDAFDKIKEDLFVTQQFSCTKQVNSEFNEPGHSKFLTNKHYAFNMNFEETKVFPNNNHEDYFAIREKIHLDKSSLLKMREVSEPGRFEKIWEIFVETEKNMAEFCKEKFSPLSEEYEDQLLLIRYSTNQTVQDLSLYKFGLSHFGNLHEDETLFSFHLGETQQALECYDYSHNKWIKEYDLESPLLLFGQCARHYGHIPTPHRLVMNEQISETVRYSFILKKVPIIKNKEENEAAAFLRFNKGSWRKNKVAFVIWRKHQDGLVADEEIIDLTKDLIETHLYFFMNQDLKKISIFTPDKFFFQNLYSKGYSHLVCIHPEVFIKCENAIDELLQLALMRPEKFFIRYHNWHHLTGLSVLNLSEEKAKYLDEAFEEDHIREFMDTHPHEYIDRLESTIFSKQIEYSTRSREEKNNILERERSEIEDHFKDGFNVTFAFNTESYRDLCALNKELVFKHCVGFASGFKLNYAAELFKGSCKKITFIDQNEYSLQLKEKMYQQWDGLNLPSWIKENKIDMTRLYEKKEIFFESCWRRELEQWGGAENFFKSWESFRKLDVQFVLLDAITEREQLGGILSEMEETLFLSSNLWNNEFVSHRFGRTQVFGQYLKWIKDLSKENKSVVILQDEVPQQSEAIKMSGVTLQSIITSYDKFI